MQLSVALAVVLALSTLCVVEAKWPVKRHDGEVVPVPETFDCSMRWLAYEYGKTLAVSDHPCLAISLVRGPMAAVWPKLDFVISMRVAMARQLRIAVLCTWLEC